MMTKFVTMAPISLNLVRPIQCTIENKIIVMGFENSQTNFERLTAKKLQLDIESKYDLRLLS